VAVLAKATGFYLGLIVEEGVIWTEDTSSLNESNANETVADRGIVSSTLEQT
jgi:hypothetical protein